MIKNKNLARFTPSLPLRDIIVFPHMVVPLFVGREKSIRALEEAMSSRKQIILSAQKKAQNNNPDEKDIFLVGTLANIIQLLRLPDGTLKVLVEGVQRIRITKYLEKDTIFRVEGEILDEAVSSMVEAEAFVRSLKTTFESYVKLNKRTPPEISHLPPPIDDPGRLTIRSFPLSILKSKRSRSFSKSGRMPQPAREAFGLLKGGRNRNPPGGKV